MSIFIYCLSSNFEHVTFGTILLERFCDHFEKLAFQKKYNVYAKESEVLEIKLKETCVVVLLLKMEQSNNHQKPRKKIH